MTTREIRVNRHIHLYNFDLFLQIVVVSVDSIHLFVQHQMGGPELIMDIFRVDLQFFNFCNSHKSYFLRDCSWRVRIRRVLK